MRDQVANPFVFCPAAIRLLGLFVIHDSGTIRGIELDQGECGCDSRWCCELGKASESTMTSVSQVLTELLRTRQVVPEDVRGCSSSEIEEVAAANRTQLPSAYAEFLHLCGKCSGLESTGELVFYTRVLESREDAESYLVREDQSDRQPNDPITPPYRFELPSDAVVISSYLGQSFLFIRGSEGDDPPVYRFGDDDPLGATEVCPAFTDYLRRELPRLLRDAWLFRGNYQGYRC